MKATDYDVVILGGGVAGLTAALQLTDLRPATRVALVEKRAYPVPDTAWKVGESIAEVAAHYLKDVIGLESYLKEHHLRKMGLRWFVTDGRNDDISRRVEFGLIRYSPLANFHLDRGAIENHMAELAEERGVAVMDSSMVTDVDLGSDRHVVTVTPAPAPAANGNGGGNGGAAKRGAERRLTARWVIDSTGRAAFLRRRLGVGTDLPIDANASWWRTPDRLQIDEWSDDPAWRAQVPSGTRWKSTVSFVGEGYWIWVINLGSGATSVGVVADPRFIPWDRIRRYDAVMDWMQEAEPQLAKHMPPSEEGLLDFHKRMQFSANCTRAFSRHRWCLTGEAALFLDPLYSTGHDFTAIGNTLATDVISRDLDGAAPSDVTRRLRAHNRTFLGIVQLGLEVFPGQLAVYGDAQATAAKFVWDNASYFSILLNLFRSGHITDPAFVRGLREEMITNSQMNRYMQRSFRTWAQTDWDTRAAGIPVGSDFLMRNLFETPLEPMSKDALAEHVRTSVSRLHSMSREMTERMAEAAGRPAEPAPYDEPERSEETLLTWSDFERRTGPPAEQEPQPSDGWLLR